MSLLLALRSRTSSAAVTTTRHMLLLTLSTHVSVGVPPEDHVGSSLGSSTVNATGTSIASSVGTTDGIASASAVGEAFGAAVSAVAQSSGSATVSGVSFRDVPFELTVELGLGGSYRAWLKNRETCVRHWFLGDVGTVQARDEMTTDASGDGVYIGSPAKGRGMLPEYGLSATFDGVDDKIEVTSGLTGTGGTFSLVSLVRPHLDGAGTARTIKRTGANGAGFLGIDTQNRAVFGVSGGSQLQSTVTLLPDHVYLLVGSYDGTDGTLFVCDVESGDIDVTGPTALTFTATHGAGWIGADA